MGNESTVEKRKYKNPLGRHIFWMCLVFTVILCVIMGVIGFFVFEDRMMAQYETNLSDVLDLVERRIDIEDLEECIKTCEKSEEFENMTRFLEQVRDSYELDHVVITVPLKEGEEYDVMQVVSGLNEAERGGALIEGIPVPQLGDRIGSSFPTYLPPILYNSFINSEGVVFTKGTTDYGSTYAAALTLRNEDNEPVAQLSTGLSLAFIDNAKQEFIQIVIVAGVLLCIVFVAITQYWIKRRIAKPLSQIERAAVEFEAKSHNQNNPDVLVMDLPEIHTGDELESLSNSLFAMSISMKDYVQNLIDSLSEVSSLKKDLDDSKKKAMQFSEMAIKDALTGIRNKAGYDKEVDKIVAGLENGEDEFGVVMVDLNYLKHINDEYGHEKGNIAIQNLCRVVCTVFTHSPVFRIGGDEFAAILRGEDYRNIDFLIDVFNNRIEDLQTDAILSPWERTSAAIGYALYDARLDTCYDDVFKRADDAMYARKKEMKAARVD